MIRKRDRMRQKRTTVGRKSRRKGYKYTAAKHRCYKRSHLLDRIVQQIQKQRPESFRTRKSQRIFCTEDTCVKQESNPSQYTIYCIANTSYFASKGNLSASVALSFLKLFTQVDANRDKSRYLNDWEDGGEKLVVLDGINHRHLRYLEDELRYAAVSTHSFKKKWGLSHLILVLSVLGREDELEECLDGLDHVR